MQKSFNFFYTFLLAILGIGATLMAEDITLTTYYPAPYGAYEELTTEGNTYLAMSSGKTGVGIASTETLLSQLEIDGNVAIGYAAGQAGPTKGLTVQGSVNIQGSPLLGTGEALLVTGTVNATAYSVNSTAGVDGTFTTADVPAKIVTVTKGIITSIL